MSTSTSEIQINDLQRFLACTPSRENFMRVMMLLSGWEDEGSLSKSIKWADEQLDVWGDVYRVCDERCWDALQKNALCLSLLRVLELTDPELYYEDELDLKVLSKATHLTHLIRLSVHPYLVEDDVVAMSLANARHLASLETFDFGEHEPLSVPLSVLCKSPFLKDCVLESFRGHMDDFDAEQQFWMEVSGL